uniref:Uncharacterized protein n=1 Tax=viral metagenome TaxID=1070528 RepID=A0A6C0C7N5_9ZZZZ
MAFLRKQTTEGSIGLLYSIIQKCIRRGMEEECLYYSDILFKEGTPNSLRKRLVYVTNEDICNLKLSNEIMECSDEDLYKYVVLCCRMKKTHDSAWLSRLSLHYAMNNIDTDNEELIEAIKMTEFIRTDNYKKVREYIGKEYNKLYSFSGKNNLVWASYIMIKRRPELNQEYSLDIDLDSIEKRKFSNIPFWVMDKHVSGGQKGYQFFFDNSLIVNENIYENGDKYAEECMKVYLEDEKNIGNGKTKILYKLWKEGIKDIPDIYEKKIPGYKDVVQIQLITSKNKPPVYFVTSLDDNKKYVLKGPMTIKIRKQIMRTENIKKDIGLNHLNVEFINIFNQNWMRADSLLDYDFNKKELKTSKLEKNVYIYNGVNNNYNFDNINEENFMEFFKNYIFRLIVGTNDHCSRNFITDGVNVYSIDDHCLDLEFDDLLNIKMKKDIKEKCKEYIILNKSNIIEILNKWRKRFINENMIKRIDKIISMV